MEELCAAKGVKIGYAFRKCRIFHMDFLLRKDGKNRGEPVRQSLHAERYCKRAVCSDQSMTIMEKKHL